MQPIFSTASRQDGKYVLKTNSGTLLSFTRLSFYTDVSRGTFIRLTDAKDMRGSLLGSIDVCFASIEWMAEGELAPPAGDS